MIARAIVQSGPARTVLGEPLTQAEAERGGVAHTATWGAVAGASLSDLRSIATQTILKAQPLRPVAHLNLSVDGYVLPSAPASVFATGREHSVPMIMGSAARDFTPGAEPPNDLAALMADTYGPLAERARALYAADDPVYGAPVVQLATDLGFRCGTVLQLNQHSSAGHRTYAYEFARLATPPIQPGGNIHGLDSLFVFGTLVTRAQNTNVLPLALTPADSRLSDVMQQYWVNFVKTGNPNGPALPTWPAYREPERAYVDLAPDGVTVKRALRRAQCELYIENANRIAASTRGR
jgi:para-nitrobenzyl esterase